VWRYLAPFPPVHSDFRDVESEWELYLDVYFLKSLDNLRMPNDLSVAFNQ
jgi:hypothetical protein